MDEAEVLLGAEAIRMADAYLKLDPSMLADLLEVSATLRKRPTLRDMTMECVGELDEVLKNRAEIDPFFKRLNEQVEPTLEPILHPHTGMFRALLVVAVLPYTLQLYRSWKIPTQVLTDTMSDVSIWSRSYHQEHGVWGLQNLRWLLHHLKGQLFRIGRLQFMVDAFTHSFVMFQHEEGSKVCLLSEEGISYRADGLVNGTNRVEAGEERWEARYSETPTDYIGHPMHATGYVHRHTVQLSKKEWRLILRKGDPILDVHIPEDGRLTMEQCLASFQAAKLFFEQHVPQHRARAFVCTSWLLDSQFQSILPPTSNIVQFQQLFRLFPVLSYAEETYSRVFGKHELNPETAPRDTSLRRAILKYIQEGNHMRAAAGVRLVDESVT